MKIVQINTTINTGSTGRIAEGIGTVLLDSGHESYIAYGRSGNPSQSREIKIGTPLDNYLHGAKTLLFDRHGFGSTRATQELVQQLEEIQPDAIGMHNLHGYYLNIDVLFSYLKRRKIPVLWTFHDCWPFTGHCTFFDSVACSKWKTQCTSCPKTSHYPKSIVLDNSRKNYQDKKRIFNDVQHLNIITPCNWLSRHVKNSFLSSYPVHVIYNGLDLDMFYPKVQQENTKIILGVASTWDERKGLADFIRLRKVLPEDYSMVLIGLSTTQIEQLPPGITGIARTESVEELAKWYSKALCFVNPTYQDNFPTTNIEALACGTPVVTYDTGGSPEAADDETGKVVQKGDIAGLKEAILFLKHQNQEALSKACRLRAEACFDQKERYREYVDLYEKLAH